MMSIIGVNGIQSLMESRLAGSNTAIYSNLSVCISMTITPNTGSASDKPALMALCNAVNRTVVKDGKSMVVRRFVLV